MNKQLLTVGYEIPGFTDNNVDFHGKFSLMDADLVLVSPDSIGPIGDWVSFSAGGGCYNVDPSKQFEEKLSRFKKEIQDLLIAGKCIFILLSSKKEYSLAQNVTTPRKGQHTYNTKTANNYDFLPISIGTLTTANGKHLNFTGYSIFSLFHKNFSNKLEYQLYIENAKAAQIIYTGKDNKKILGGVYRVGLGHMVVLPMVAFNETEFTETKKTSDGKENYYWNKKGLAFGNNLVNCLLDIDDKLTNDSKKTVTPNWISKNLYSIKKEIIIKDLINSNLGKVAKIEQENDKLKIELAEETRLKDLLYENGTPLESAVIKALIILGYQAENYDDGELEMDQVILSPEKHRYIGECEGKDSKDIDITKFRQLQDALNADFSRDEIEEKAFGILFGNAERLVDPEKRKLDFTTKCKSGAAREKIALIKTIDLFRIAKYLIENPDEQFRIACRNAIHENLGKIVIFPKIPDHD
ncbi:MAG: hypothetical protein ABIQ88_17195 [Chitinophagaceae bacterium]